MLALRSRQWPDHCSLVTERRSRRGDRAPPRYLARTRLACPFRPVEHTHPHSPVCSRHSLPLLDVIRASRGGLSPNFCSNQQLRYKIQWFGLLDPKKKINQDKVVYRPCQRHGASMAHGPMPGRRRARHPPCVAKLASHRRSASPVTSLQIDPRAQCRTLLCSGDHEAGRLRVGGKLHGARKQTPGRQICRTSTCVRERAILPAPRKQCPAVAPAL